MGRIRVIPVLLCVGILTASAAAGVVFDNGGPVQGAGYETTIFLVAEDFMLSDDTFIGGAAVYVGDINPAADVWGALGNPLAWFVLADGGGGTQPGGTVLASGAAQNLNVTDTGLLWGGENIAKAEFDFGSSFAAQAGVT